MHTLVVYESMYGNTHAIADAIAEGLREHGDVRVVPVGDATEEVVAWADLVVAGGPTYMHGMTRSTTRKSAFERADQPDSQLTVDADASGPGIREWLDSLGHVHDKQGAAFDTRVTGPTLLTGQASGSISKGLRGLGFKLIAKPQSFLVDKQSVLVDGERERATQWGAGLAAALVPTA